MSWLGYIGLVVVLAIGGWIYYAHPGTAVAPEQQAEQGVKSISAVRDVCMASATHAYKTDLMIALVDCPTDASGVADASCVQKTSDGAQAYAKYESAISGCGN